MKTKEKTNREKIKKEKPLVYEKIIKNQNNLKPIIQMQWRYTCNMTCTHCSIASIQNQNKDRKLISIEDLKDFSKQADELGIFRFEINGGEPFTYKNYDEIVNAIDSTRYYMNTVTNAWLLDLKKAKHLKSIGIDRVQIGLDSLSKEEHDKFRNKKGAHKRCIQAIDYCNQVGLDVFTTTVVTKQRLYSEEFIDFIKFVNGKGAGVFVSFAKPVGAWENNFDILVTNEDLLYFEELEQKYNVFSHLTPKYDGKRGCLAFNDLIALNPYGDIMPCQYIFVKIGNILEEPLKDILERGNRLKPFKTKTCPIAVDTNFIKKYIIDRVQGKELPVDYKEVFTKEDFE